MRAAKGVQVQTSMTTTNNETRRHPAGGMPRAGILKAALLPALLCAGLAQAGVPAPVTVTYTVTTQAPTCNVTLPQGGTVALTPATVADFSTSPLKKAGATFAVTLSGCTGQPTAGTTPNLTLWGTPDNTKGDTTLFKNAITTGGAAGLGFVLTKDTTGVGALLPVGTQGSPYAIPVTMSSGTGRVDFFAMPSRGNYATGDVTAGTMSTVLKFNMDYR